MSSASFLALGARTGLSSGLALILACCSCCASRAHKPHPQFEQCPRRQASDGVPFVIRPTALEDRFMKPDRGAEVPTVPAHRPSRPSVAVTHADAPPIWLSTDLRDGNQALIDPMDAERKLRMFRELVRIGFKEIEVGFPSASQTDFDFVRKLIEEDLDPDDVTIQVLTQSREELIRRTFESVRGVEARDRAISTTRRRRCSAASCTARDKAGIVEIAVQGAAWFAAVRGRAAGTDWRYEYSPETFTMTELPFAKEICEAVMDVWQPDAAAPGDPQPARPRSRSRRPTSTPTRSSGCTRT
jgi:hypothetical protein